MNKFFAPDITHSEIYSLNEKEIHHAIHVLRIKTGEEIQLLDGKGNIYSATVSAITKKNVSVKVLSKKTCNKKNYHLHIAIAPTKSTDRFNFFLEKATELGIDEITPVITHNSERRKLNTEKEKQNLIAAIKQSGNPFLPQLNELIDFKKFLGRTNNSDAQKFICHCRTDEKKLLVKSVKANKNVLICIGPEGDFTKEEIELSIKNNFDAVNLGETILRTETAGIMACSIIHIINDLSK